MSPWSFSLLGAEKTAATIPISLRAALAQLKCILCQRQTSLTRKTQTGRDPQPLAVTYRPESISVLGNTFLRISLKTGALQRTMEKSRGMSQTRNLKYAEREDVG